MTKITIKINSRDYLNCHRCRSDDMRSKQCPSNAELDQIEFFMMTCGSCGTRHVIDDKYYFKALSLWKNKDTSNEECERFKQY